MRGNEFLDKLEFIDPAYVAEADEQPARKRMVWLKWGGLAACVCVVAAAALAFAGINWRLEERCITVESQPPGPDGPVIDRPQELTSDTYSSLEELLDDLRLRDGHTLEKRDGIQNGNGGYSAAHAAMEGADTVSWQGAVYQITGDAGVGVYQNGRLTGTVDVPADYLFVSGGRLVTVGAERCSGDELDPVYCVRVNLFDLADPARPEQLDSFTQLGGLTACWLSGGQLYLMTDDGVCACGYSRLSDLEDYKPQLFHGEEQLSWPEEDISILGEPTRVSYAAVSRIDVETLEVTGRHAYYGDIGDVYYGGDWFALVTSSLLQEHSYTLPEIYAFTGSLSFAGKLNMAGIFGLEKTGALPLPDGGIFPAEYPDVKSVSRAGDVWRVVGEYQKNDGESWARELFAVAYDPDGPRPITKQTLRLPEDQFDIDDILWEDGRAVISAGFVRFDPYKTGARLVFAEFDGTDVTLLSSDLICDRVQGVEGIYWLGSPLGQLKPFIPLGDGLYLRYNGTPDGFDLFDLSDSAHPKCLYQSSGDIPAGCRLDFKNYALNQNTVAVQLITPGEDDGYRDAVTTWAFFSIAPGSDTPVSMWGLQLPLAGTDPAVIDVPLGER